MMRRLLARVPSHRLDAACLTTAYRDLSGTVKTWKHTKGYGFLVDTEGKSFFVHRNSLNGGFFLTDGQCVKFETKMRGNRTEATDVKSLDDTPITPQGIQGVVKSIDETGGVIDELDINGDPQPDAPKFTFISSNVEPEQVLKVGGTVRFALGSDGEPIRIITVKEAEGKKSTPVSTTPASENPTPRHDQKKKTSKAAAAATTSTASTDAVGTVQEVVHVIREIHSSTGFIKVNDSKDVIYFQMNDVQGTTHVSAGDIVKFRREAARNPRHQGKEVGRSIHKIGRVAPVHNRPARN